VRNGVEIEVIIFEVLGDLRVTCDEKEARGIVNGVNDKFEAYTLRLDFLQDVVDYLLESIVLQINPVIRSGMFERIERAYGNNHALCIDLEPLIAMFDDEDTSMIANTLLLFPLAGDRNAHSAMARRYRNHRDRFIRKNARDALRYLDPESTPKYTHLFFDFDGTLANTFPFFLKNINELAHRYHFKEIDLDEVKTLRAYDAKQLLRHLEIPLWKVPMVMRRYIKKMAENSGEVALFDGIETMLHSLAEREYTLGLLTSNSEENVRHILGEANMKLFSHVVCGASLFGKASKLKNIVRKTQVDPAAVIYIGDEVRDLEAAHKAGVDFGAVVWGYMPADTLLADSPEAMFYSVEEIMDRFCK